MTRLCFTVILLAGLLTVDSLRAAGENRTLGDKYPNLLEHSMFSRTRLRPELRPPTTRQASRLTQLLVLTGITRIAGRADCIAFIEDLSTGLTSRLSLGDSIAQGKLTHLAMDGIEFTTGEKSIHIQLGQNLEGAEPDRSGPTNIAPSSPAPASAAFTAAAPPTTMPVVESAAEDSSSDDASDDEVLNRLRARRQQELKQ